MPERPREKEEPAVREASEAVDGHLGDMLQQLHSVNASKPSERGLVRQGGHCGPGRLERAGKSAPECWWLVQAPGSVIPLLPAFPVHYSANKLAYWPRPSMVRPLPFSDSSVLSPQAPHLPAPPRAACIHWLTLSPLLRESLCSLQDSGNNRPRCAPASGPLLSRQALPPDHCKAHTPCLHVSAPESPP